MVTPHNIESEFSSGQAFLAARLTLTETGKVYVPAIPGYQSSVMIDKDGSIVTLKPTNDYIPGGNADDLKYADAISSGTTNYIGSSPAGLTAFEIDVTTYANDVTVVVLQFKLK